MANRPAVETRLSEPDAALRSLLTDLLVEVPDTDTDTNPGPGHAPADGVALPASGPALNPEPNPPLPSKDALSAAWPAWAGETFRVLLFRIGEQRFAMPLVLMRSVFLHPQRLGRVPAQPAWHSGIARHRGASVVVVDLGRLLGVRAACTRARYLLQLGDGSRAVACDTLDDTPQVRSGEVHWRKTGGRQPWLAGMLTEPLCGLLDADAIDNEIRHG